MKIHKKNQLLNPDLNAESFRLISRHVNMAAGSVKVASMMQNVFSFFSQQINITPLKPKK